MNDKLAGLLAAIDMGLKNEIMIVRNQFRFNLISLLTDPAAASILGLASTITGIVDRTGSSR